MMALEQTFDVQLEVEDFPRLTSVPAILDYLKHAGRFLNASHSHAAMRRQ